MSGEDEHWDSAGVMDANTWHLLSYAGVRCRVIGTFYLEQNPKSEAEEDLVLKFGSDISNYYPNRGLKVYKPNERALANIVNYRDPDRADAQTQRKVVVGQIRYASTNRAFQGVSNVNVELNPADLLGQKTALFGMTRTGKSNTTKIVLQSVFKLRFEKDEPLRVGQIVFDYNGEYANENEQDGNKQNPDAVKNVWATHKDGVRGDVITYGITPHPQDPERKLMLLNFFEEANLQIGKELIDSALADDDSKYIRNFCDVTFEKPAPDDWSAMTRYNRHILVYRALLSKAGFSVPAKIKPDITNLSNKPLRDKMKLSANADHIAAGNLLDKQSVTWAELTTALAGLYDFMMAPKGGYSDFEQQYIKTSSTGDTWADEKLKKLLEMFSRPNGSRLIGKLLPQHTIDTSSDYAVDIYAELVAGRLVIVDQSSGDNEINKASAKRIMRHIFLKNQQIFREGKTPPEILLYLEEAHNLLPPGTETDTSDIWVRTAKEGAKYHIGLVYATQEVSSIQRNILKNTANWFIGHLNNTDETKELCKYYDFADFEPSICRAQDRGFLRVKTLSNLFVIPVQIKKFEVKQNAV